MNQSIDEVDDGNGVGTELGPLVGLFTNNGRRSRGGNALVVDNLLDPMDGFKINNTPGRTLSMPKNKGLFVGVETVYNNSTLENRYDNF